jgi:hypothetical protein
MGDVGAVIIHLNDTGRSLAASIGDVVSALDHRDVRPKPTGGAMVKSSSWPKCLPSLPRVSVMTTPFLAETLRP